MLIGLLFIVFLVLWSITFELFDRDLTSPSMLLVSGYTVCVGMAVLSYFSFPYTYHPQTLYVMILGTVLFLVPAYAIKRIALKREESVLPEMTESVVAIKSWVLFLSALLLIGVIVLTIFTYVRILQCYESAATYASAIPRMRNLLIMHPEVGAVREFLILNQIKKLFLIGGWFLLYIYVRNCAIRHSFFSDKGLLINLFFVVCLIGTGGGRAGIVAFLLGGMGLYAFFCYVYNGVRVRLSLNLFLKLIGGGITAAVVFFALLFLTGRGVGNFDMRSLWTHVQIYLAGPVPLLDHFLLYPLSGGGDVFGKETFYALNSQLAKLHFIDTPLYSPHLEFRPDVYLGGNCYTAYRSYLYDFGYTGLVLCPVLFSFLINGFYYACVRWAKKRVFVAPLILYSTVIYSIFIDFERSCFFTYWLNFSVLIYLMGFILLRWVLLRAGWMQVFPIKNSK